MVSTRTTRFVDLEDELHSAAVQATGLRDFGSEDYKEGLRVLLEAYDTDPQLTQLGWQFAYGSVLGTLIARLHTQSGWAKHPPGSAAPIRRPLVITGIPRTGTTALHKLLSMDPQFQGLEHWLTETPMVRPTREAWESLPAYRSSVANLEAYFTLMPDMRKAHDMVADEVDECLEILRQSFVSNRFGSSTYVPSYDRWFFAQSEVLSYRRYADVLRLIGTDQPEKRWLLKNPGHIATIEALFEVFPDACVVQTHRDPLEAIPSLCSVLHMSRRMFEGDSASAEVIGPRECSYWRKALEDTTAARKRRRDQFFDIDHRRFVADPLGTVRELYAHFGLQLAAAAEEAMCGWIAASPTSRHGEHRYDGDRFGITAEDIREAFEDYRARFNFN
jgi:Sulfotransferase family